MRVRIEQTIRAIPRGKVSTYGAVARAPDFRERRGRWRPCYAGDLDCPGSGCWALAVRSNYKVTRQIEQRLRLEAEGVRFRGRKVDMRACEFTVRTATERRDETKAGHSHSRRPVEALDPALDSSAGQLSRVMRIIF